MKNLLLLLLLAAPGMAFGQAAALPAPSLSTVPTLCPSGQAPTGILANGNATGCATSGGGGTPAVTMAAHAYATNGASPKTTNSVTVTIGQWAIVSCRTGATPASFSFTDSLGNTFTSPVLGFFSANGVAMAYSHLTVGGADTFTCTPAGGDANTSVDVTVVSGPTSYVAYAGQTTTSAFVVGQVSAPTLSTPTVQRTFVAGCTQNSNTANSYAGASYINNGDVTSLFSTNSNASLALTEVQVCSFWLNPTSEAAIPYFISTIDGSAASEILVFDY